MLNGLLKEQLEFAKGYKGNQKADENKVKEAFDPRLLTLSLAGEPTIYPHVCELIKLAKEKGMFVFLVTNGTLPHRLLELEKRVCLPTQLYISMDAPDEDSYKKTCRPIDDSMWQRYNDSLKIMNRLKGKTRTVLRMTLVRGYNTDNLEGYADQIKTAEPDYVEVKSFVYVGGARHKDRGLRLEDMLKMDEVREIARRLSELTGYKYTDEHELSRVVLLVRDTAAEEKRILRV